jgi:hypothetical protein
MHFIHVNRSVMKNRLLMRRYRSMGDFLRELWSFLKIRKRFWLAPIILILLLLGALIVFSGSSAMAPFIYTLF